MRAHSLCFSVTRRGPCLVTRVEWWRREFRCRLVLAAHGTAARNSVPYIASLMPRRISHTLAGHAVANPMIMPTCMRNQ